MRTLIAVCLLGILGGCTKPNTTGGTAVIALSSDVESLNPLFASGSNASILTYFLFPDLVEHSFNYRTGRDSCIPALARSWEFSNDGKDLTYRLRGDARWSNGESITAGDIKFTLQRYADPKTSSVRRSKFDLLITKPSGEPDLDRAIEVFNDSTVRFHFKAAYSRPIMLDHTQLAFLPRTAWDSIPPQQMRTAPINFSPVSAKHFILDQWVRKQEIRLKKNGDWNIPDAATLDFIVFRIIPDMSTRIAELKTGQVDMIEGINADDARDLERTAPQIRIEKQSYRRYEIAGWNNLDPLAYERSAKKTIQPHPLFGNSCVRKALTLAIDRSSMIESWFGEYGQACTGPVSPAFQWAYNDTITPLKFDQIEAKRLLADEGWKDHDGDGILDRNGVKFEFTMTINAGNPRREFVLQTITSNLSKLGISVHAQVVESTVFNNGLKNRSYDAFITGFTVNMQIDLLSQYGSDLQKNTFNAASYQNLRVDSLIHAADKFGGSIEAGPLYKKIQTILYNDQPVTFLFWYDNIVAINNRLKGTHVDIYSPYHRFYEWYMDKESR